MVSLFCRTHFSISPRTTAFRCSSSTTFSGRHVSNLNTLPQLQGLEYTQFLVKLKSVWGLKRKRYLRKVEPLVNIVLLSYELRIFRILSTRSLTEGRHTVVSFRVSLSIILFRGACGVMVIVVGNEHGDTSSNPERD